MYAQVHTLAADLWVEEITHPDAVESLRAEWSELWLRSGPTTPFQSPDWLLAWHHHLRGAESPWILAIRSGHRLIGLAPFCAQQSDDGRRLVRLMGTGVSDYLDLVCESGRESTVAAMVFNHLTERADQWSTCDFHQLRADSPLLALDLGPTCRDAIETQEYCPELARENGAWPIPASFLHKLEYEGRRLDREGTFRVQSVGPQNFDRLFDALFELHGARWSRRGEGGVLSDSSVQRFHLDAARGLLNRGVLRLYSLFCDNRPAACYYGFLHQRRAYYYLSGFDPAFEKLSVGNQIIWHALREAQRENAVAFDFLRGQEPYKYRWGAKDQKTYRRTLNCG